MKLIGIAGKPGSGKDTLSSFLETEHGYIRVSLADQIRKIVIMTTGIPESRLKSHPFKDQPIKEYNSLTGRELTIAVGEAIENLLGDNAWTSMCEREMLSYYGSKFVVPDIRTEQQAQWIRSMGGKLVLIDSEISSSYAIENKLNHWDDWDLVIKSSDILDVYETESYDHIYDIIEGAAIL